MHNTSVVDTIRVPRCTGGMYVLLISSTSNLFSSVTLLEDGPMGLPDQLPDIEIYGDNMILVVVIRKQHLGDIRD